MNKKGFELLGNHTVNIIIAVLCILVLIYAGIKVYGLFSDKSDLEKATFELTQLKAKLDAVAESKVSDEYIVTSVREWYLFSEEFGSLCNGDFCLCLCEEVDCKSEPRACIATDKFVLLRKGIEDDYKETRKFQLESPFKLNLKYSGEHAYPFNAGTSVEAGWLTVKAITPLFFKYDENWKWSPDLEVWMNISELEVSSGKWKGQHPADPNIDFLKRFDGVLKKEKYPQEFGNLLFKNYGSSKSEGVLIIER
jgi:hypothetical protein